nr:DUF2953 domain-containing protein [Metabacillus lacus]
MVKVDNSSPGIELRKEKNFGEDRQVPDSQKHYDKITKKDVLTDIKDIKELLEHIVTFHEIVKRFFRKVTVTKFEWHSQFGIGDAAATGVLTGAAWSIKGALIGILSSYTRLSVLPALSITPVFVHKDSKTVLHCMIHFRIGNAILAGLRVLKHWKGGLPFIRNRPFPFLTRQQNNKSV